MADGCRLNLLLIHISSVCVCVFFLAEKVALLFHFDEFHFQIPLLISLLFSSSLLLLHLVILCIVAAGINKALSSFLDNIQRSHMWAKLRI